MGLLDTSATDKDLLLYRKWLAANKSLEDKTQLVSSIGLSSSGEWLLIKTAESLALLSAESKVGEALWKELLKFSGQGKALIIYPEKGKLGFNLDFHETKTTFYYWEDEVLMMGKKRTQKPSGILAISWKKASIQTNTSEELSQDVLSSTPVEEESKDSSGTGVTVDTKVKNTRGKGSKNSSKTQEIEA